MRKTYKHSLQLFLNDEENLELLTYCEAHGMKKSDVVRDALDAFFRNQEAQTTTDGNRQTQTRIDKIAA